MTDRRIVEAYDKLRLDSDSAARIAGVLAAAASPREEKKNMIKAKRPLRVILIAAIISVLMIGTAYALSGTVHSVGTHIMRGENEYTSLADIKKLERQAGYPVTAVESFSNGYAFRSAHIGGEAAFDENNEPLQEYYSIDFTYEKSGAADVFVNLSPVLDLPTAHEPPAPTETREIGGIEVRYSRDHYKFVPEDYKQTPEDEAALRAGHYYISYGADAVEEHDYTFATFALDGVEYCIMSCAPMDADEMYAMAADLIAAR